MAVIAGDLLDEVVVILDDYILYVLTIQQGCGVVSKLTDYESRFL